MNDTWNDMMPSIEETLTTDIEAEIEYIEWLREDAKEISASIGAEVTLEDVENYHTDMEEIYG